MQFTPVAMLHRRIALVLTIAGSLLPLSSAHGVALNLRDVPAGDPDRAAVQFLNEHDVLYGYTDGTFHPDANVTRGEILKIALEAAGEGSMALRIGSAGVAQYNDMSSAHTLAPYIGFATSRGQISGYADGSFRPDAQVTRAEAAKIVANILSAPGGGGGPYTDYDGSTLTPFMERTYAANWFRPAPPLYNPNIPATRREVARMTYRALVASATTSTKVYADSLLPPAAVPSDWILEDGELSYAVPPGWTHAWGEAEHEGITFLAAFAALDETGDPAFALMSIDAENAAKLPGSTDNTVPSLRMFALDVNGGTRSVATMEVRTDEGLVIGWSAGNRVYLAVYDDTGFPGLGGAFLRFVQYALERSGA